MWAVLPIKNLENVKTRLSPSLSLPERIELFHCMVHDVIAAVSAVSVLNGVLVVTRDQHIKRLARMFGAQILEETRNDGHDVAVARAALWLSASGAKGFMQIPGDIPTVTPDELAEVIAVHASSQRSRAFTISPSHDYGGSNCIICTPPDLIPLKFGEDSFRRHLASARAAGIETRVVERPGIALDIDNPKDIACLATTPGNTRTHRFLDESGIGQRVLHDLSASSIDRRIA